MIASCLPWGLSSRLCTRISIFFIPMRFSPTHSTVALTFLKPGMEMLLMLMMFSVETALKYLVPPFNIGQDICGNGTPLLTHTQLSSSPRTKQRELFRIIGESKYKLWWVYLKYVFHRLTWNENLWCGISEMIHTSYFEDNSTFSPNTSLMCHCAGELSIVMFRLRINSHYRKVLFLSRHSISILSSFIRPNPSPHNVC